MQLVQEKMLAGQLSEKMERELNEMKEAKEKLEEERDALRLDSIAYLDVNDKLEKQVGSLKQSLSGIEDNQKEIGRLEGIVREKEGRIQELEELSRARATVQPAPLLAGPATETGESREGTAGISLELATEKERKFELEKEKLTGEITVLGNKLGLLEDILGQERALFHYNLGVAYSRAQLYDEAMVAYEKSLKFEADNPEAYYNLGLLHGEVKQDFLMAAFYYRKYLKANPTADDRQEIEQLIDQHMVGEFK